MKTRVDLLLVSSGHFETREKARRAVIAGDVYFGTERVDKASRLIPEEQAGLLSVRKKDPAVSRAFYKLKHALEVFKVTVEDRVCLDVGSSTGGFSQQLLESGAHLVYAVDCGTNQLDYSLRRNPRIVSMEKTNARYLTPQMFDPEPDLAVMDVSFISSTLLVPVLSDPLHISECVLLIKPQFEAGRDQVGKGGIVTDPGVWRNVLDTVIEKNASCGFHCCGLTVSPVIGTKGNVEFLGYFRRQPSAVPDVAAVVAAATSRKCR